MSSPPYYQNSPPPKSGSGGCWKAAGITCGVLVVLGVIGVIIVAQQVKKAINDPKNKGLMGSIMGSMNTVRDGMKIRQAVIAYHDKSGGYPATLTNLVPAYLPNPSILHAQTDINHDPKHVSWTYMRPSENADPKTPILKTAMVMEMGGKSTTSNIVISLDGSTASGNAAPGSSM